METSTRGAEWERLAADTRRHGNWKRWGPYLSERQWGTVREDYSGDGEVWDAFTHEHARSRAYRWGEDGLLGITDRQCRLCFGLVLWNGRDAILKERLFGLSGKQGNHGEDVKECYYYLDSTPTYSYLKGLYKYPQGEFPYRRLLEENARRSRAEREFELEDCGVFEGNRYFDVQAEYAKRTPEDVLIRLTLSNRGDEPATLHLLPTLWFRNTWSWDRRGEAYWRKPRLSRLHASALLSEHESLGTHHLYVEARGGHPEFLFTDNESNLQRLFNAKGGARHPKDAFHDFIVHGDKRALNPAEEGTKAAAHYVLQLGPGESTVVRLRLVHEKEAPKEPFGPGFEAVFDERLREADEFHAARAPSEATPEERRVLRQAYAGLLWSKQYYQYAVKEWLEGDPAYPPPPRERLLGRNHDWRHLYNRDVISMPDKWEYPWYAAWDLAFHMIPFVRVDPEFAKAQLLLFLREWYMHPNGQLPAYEFNFSDVNPPVHAWSCYRVYKMAAPRGKRDRLFLERVFQKLLINFTWWVNRKDPDGKHLFSGGFLGLDNIGVFDRSRPLPTGGALEQADGTAWMAFFCSTMLAMALELAREDPAYEDIASKFFEHFVAITDAINTLGGHGLWDEEDGFYYDQLRLGDDSMPLKIRSMVGIVPLLAAEVLEDEVTENLPGFTKRLEWFLENRPELASHITYMCTPESKGHCGRLLAIPSRERLVRVLRYVLDENEFLSPYGVRSLSKVHGEKPYVLRTGAGEYRVDYLPAESDSGMFGGNSNWRGPVWFPLNYLLIEALDRYHFFYGDSLEVECPTGSGRWMTLDKVAEELAARLSRLFLPDGSGQRPAHGTDPRYATDPHWRELVLFYEYFNGETGRGMGASHQTGWTALVAQCIETACRGRAKAR